MRHPDAEVRRSKTFLVLGALAAALVGAALYFLHPSDTSTMDPDAMPRVPDEFEVSLFAREPIVGNPASMAFDGQGRLFVGMGPQYRNPTPDTPGDRVVMLVDSDGDGRADQAKDFAKGLNCIQGLAWHGRDLWIANAPDLTIARDLDGDDEADEYVRVFTGLGNLEHALHGLIWGPDGKLYMTKGNSKGAANDGHVAPKPFRELWGVNAPAGTPDFPPAEIFPRDGYRHAYQDPNDDWGREGGMLRCDDRGENLEIFARGLRNPFDLVFDSEYNWLGTDNDQHEGDRVVMPFAGAHFGWGHSWSAHWTGAGNPPTVPVSGPLFPGSGTGAVFYDAAQFPESWRGIWLLNDWELKKTYAYRPKWEGALIQPEGGKWTEFAVAGDSYYRPTDMEIGPDGALWVLSWGRRYNRPQKLVRNFLGQASQLEGRIYRIAAKGRPPLEWRSAKRNRPRSEWTVAELAEDLGSHVVAWRVDAQSELVRRGAEVREELRQLLASPNLPRAQETWLLWTLGRLGEALPFGPDLPLNRRLQALRIAGEFARPLPDGIAEVLRDREPRLRFAAAQAIWRARDTRLLSAVQDLADTETDRLVSYVAWTTLRDLADAATLRSWLHGERAGLRRAAFLALADLGQITSDDATALVGDAATTDVAALWLTRRSGNPFITFEPMPGEFEGEVTVYLTPGLKPSDIRYTTDGSTPTAQSPIFPESSSLKLKSTTTIRAALFVDGTQVGEPAEAIYTRASAESAPAVTLQPPAQPTTVDAALAVLKAGQSSRGAGVFRAAGCVNCHRLGTAGRPFGPDLTGIVESQEPEHLVRSILEPNAAITEGFALLNVTTDDGQQHAGIFREETDLHLTLAQPAGQSLRLEKAHITGRESTHTSPMPPYAAMLSPENVADLVAWLTHGRSAQSRVVSGR